jgi:PAS domain-containing protein
MPKSIAAFSRACPVAVCVVDLQQKIVLWSDGAEKITGHPRHEVIGHSYAAEALLPCDQPGCEESGEECPLVQAIKMSHTIEGIGYLRHKAGYEILAGTLRGVWL